MLPGFKGRMMTTAALNVGKQFFPSLHGIIIRVPPSGDS
jgi:hypothetical protein